MSLVTVSNHLAANTTEFNVEKFIFLTLHPGPGRIEAPFTRLVSAPLSLVCSLRPYLEIFTPWGQISAGWRPH